MKNIVRRNDVFHTQQLEEYFKMSKKYKKYGTCDRVNKKNWTQLTKTIENKIYQIRSENDETISKKRKRNPIKQQTERCVKMTKNQR